MFKLWCKGVLDDYITKRVEEEISKKLVDLPSIQKIEMSIPSSGDSDLKGLISFIDKVDKISKLNVKINYVTSVGSLEDLSINTSGDILNDLYTQLDDREYPPHVSHYSEIGVHVGGTLDGQHYSRYFTVLNHGRYTSKTIDKYLDRFRAEIKKNFPETLI